MPKPGAWVLAVFRHGGKGSQRVIRAMHAPKHTLTEELYGEFSPEGDYDPETDCTYWPEGWYECNEFEETNWCVHEEITHWMPLPVAPESNVPVQHKGGE